jgi:redox-regulated HSP33 family molecular chaperone
MKRTSLLVRIISSSSLKGFLTVVKDFMLTGSNRFRKENPKITTVKAAKTPLLVESGGVSFLAVTYFRSKKRPGYHQLYNPLIVLSDGRLVPTIKSYFVKSELINR